MRLLGRLLIVPFGLILAIPAGFLVLVIGSLREPAVAGLLAALAEAGLGLLLGEVHPGGRPDLVAAHLALGVWGLLVLLVIAPPTVTALAAEIVGARSAAFHGTLCGLLTALLPWLARDRMGEGASLLAEGRITALLFVTGAAAGLVHWAVAGRSAGAPRETLDPPARPHATGV